MLERNQTRGIYFFRDENNSVIATGGAPEAKAILELSKLPKFDQHPMQFSSQEGTATILFEDAKLRSQFKQELLRRGFPDLTGQQQIVYASRPGMIQQ